MANDDLYEEAAPVGQTTSSGGDAWPEFVDKQPAVDDGLYDSGTFYPSTFTLSSPCNRLVPARAPVTSDEATSVGGESNIGPSLAYVRFFRFHDSAWELNGRRKAAVNIGTGLLWERGSQ